MPAMQIPALRPPLDLHQLVQIAQDEQARYNASLGLDANASLAEVLNAIAQSWPEEFRPPVMSDEMRAESRRKERARRDRMHAFLERVCRRPRSS